MSTKDFPEGINLGGNWVVPSGQKLFVNAPVMFSATGIAGQSNDITIRTRVTLAEMNAGKTLLAGYPGAMWVMKDVKCISIGGALAATAAATGYAIYGTQAGTAVKLYEVLLAAGTENTLCYPGLANTNILAAGASFRQNDPNTTITCKAVSAGAFDLITATHFDILLTMSLEV